MPFAVQDLDFAAVVSGVQEGQRLALVVHDADHPAVFGGFNARARRAALIERDEVSLVFVSPKLQAGPAIFSQEAE
jgi:hypothetical protein